MKLKYFATAIAALALAGCSNEEDVLDNNQQEVAKTGENSYLSITIKNTAKTDSRAASFDGYEDGYVGGENAKAEGYVKNIRFYLFKADGSARNIGNAFTDDNASTNPAVNYVDYTVNQNVTAPSQSAENGDDVEEGAWAAEGNIESTISAVLVIKEEKSDLPAQIVAVANYDQCSELKQTGSLSLAQLQSIIGDYDITNPVNGAFLMSNSVYSNDTKTITAQEITAANWGNSVAAAKANPVTIHIERVIAKVEIDWTGFSAGNKIKVGDAPQIDGNSKDIYAVIKGWGVTRVREKSTLLKNLNATYNTLGTTNWWNDKTAFRSYWAETTTTNNGISHPYTYASLANGNPDYIYCQENTSNDKGTVSGYVDNNDGYTEVVFAAELQDANGKAVTLYEYAGQYFTSPASILATIGSTAKIFVLSDELTYTAAGVDYTEKNYKSISATELTFAAEDQTTGTRYKAVPTVKEDLENVTFVTLDTKAGSATNGKLIEISANDVNSALKEYAINVYNNGMSYYYIDIEQYTETVNDKSTTFKGVVRNHIYRIKPTAIKSFGVPVYDATKNIITEPKNEENTYIAAEVNVLSWHKVNQEVELK